MNNSTNAIYRHSPTIIYNSETLNKISLTHEYLIFTHKIYSTPGEKSNSVRNEYYITDTRPLRIAITDNVRINPIHIRYYSVLLCNSIPLLMS